MHGTTATRTKKSTRKRSRQPRRKRRRAQRNVMSAKDLPSWSDLSGDSDTESEAPRNTWYFVVIVAVLAAGLTMYVGHVKSTQHLIVDLQEQRNLNHQLLMQKEHLQGEYDRVTGPSIIYDRAAALGLEQTAGPVYQLTPPSE